MGFNLKSGKFGHEFYLIESFKHFVVSILQLFGKDISYWSYEIHITKLPSAYS